MEKLQKIIGTAVNCDAAPILFNPETGMSPERGGLAEVELGGVDDVEAGGEVGEDVHTGGNLTGLYAAVNRSHGDVCVRRGFHNESGTD